MGQSTFFIFAMRIEKNNPFNKFKNCTIKLFKYFAHMYTVLTARFCKHEFFLFFWNKPHKLIFTGEKS